MKEEEGEGTSSKGEVKQEASSFAQVPLLEVTQAEGHAAKAEEKGQNRGQRAEREDVPGQSDELFHSYSDSSDASSDEFFDADTVLEPAPHAPILTSPSVSVPAAEGDPDDVEEDRELQEQDDTSGGVAANKSVIMHMLSQVRVGVDLTKIVLPTFILEKRSLLEMYAEFFAHPDVFARSVVSQFVAVVTMTICLDSIADYSDPKDRMIAIVRYYLSAFHSARKVRDHLHHPTLPLTSWRR